MTRYQLTSLIRSRQSCLCVGLDTDPRLLPASVQSEPDPVFAFNKAIIEQTSPFCVAYKINTAFYEQLGPQGWDSLTKTLEVIPTDHFVIADAKRGDIGNTSLRYARAFLETLNCDAITVAPYMGSDSVEPFLKIDGKWAIVLALTSNTGSADFQQLTLSDGRKLYEQVLLTAASWGTPDNMMFVVGATHPEALSGIRELVPDHFLLVPGVGAQGGSLEAVARHALNEDVGLLVNSSRSILYASSAPDFAHRAAQEARLLQQQMAAFL
jgi:orotidine-5'-phosphate decarboxylase